MRRRMENIGRGMSTAQAEELGSEDVAQEGTNEDESTEGTPDAE